jgi:MFS family permease
MSIGIGTETKIRLFYGWWIVAAGLLVIAYGTGASGFITRNLFSPIGSNANKVATALGIYSGVMTIASLAIGPLIDRFGPRKLMLIGIPAASGAILGLSFANSLLYIFLGILAIGMSAGFLLPVQTATANWFMKRRSTALAVVCAASALGGPVVNRLGNQVMHQFSLQNTLLGLGIAMLAIGIPLAFVIKHKPEQHGYMPDGMVPIIKETIQPIIKKETHFVEVNFSLRQALRTKAFWILVVAISLANGSGTLVESRRSIYMVEQGLHYRPANFSELASLMGLVWILLFGFLGDKFSKRHLLAIAIALQSISVVVLINVGNLTQLYFYMLVHGFGSGIAPLILAMRADYFGRKAFATITVVMGFIGGIVSVGFVFLNQFILGPTGNYQVVFLLSMLIGLVAAATVIFAEPPELPHHKLPDHKTA